MSLKKSLLSLLVALVCVAAGEGSSLAQNEPNDDVFPGGTSIWYGSPYENMCNDASQICRYPYAGISTATDVDYVVATCGHSIVTTIQIQLMPYAGDLDLDVYKPSGTPIGNSRGTGMYETVNTRSANMNSVVAKIYGYKGATGPYQVTVFCDP